LAAAITKLIAGGSRIAPPKGGMVRKFGGAVGFSLIDTMMAIAIGAILCAVAIPSISRSLDSARVIAATRGLERELQMAKLKAVSLNRVMRLRINCPASQNAVRFVEITGVALTDTASNRCDANVYPYPGPRDNDPATPEADGPVRHVDARLTVTGNDVEFSPKGTATTVVAGTPKAIASTVSITVSGGGFTGFVDVTALGKIDIR
jgi:Tfp pilus assembly protein FimT